MGARACAVALWCALAVAGAAAYTVDCNHEYTDCDTELSKIGADEDEVPSSTSTPEPTTSSTNAIPFLPTVVVPLRVASSVTITTDENKKLESSTKQSEVAEVLGSAAEVTETPKQGRLLNLNVDELQNFANALHNETNKQKNSKVDLSDVNMDDEDEEPSRISIHDHSKHDKHISDKFYTNLQVPFHPLLGIDNRASEEQDTCKENEVNYKIGDRIDRGCDESCECQPGGTFECTPRCKHPYIRRGRRLSDPLCFESPVDECCSIVACATGNQDVKVNKVDVCRYNNDTYSVGEKWHIGCEQTCSCEANSVVTCKPRCKKLIASDKCINVQDPNDECCEVQVCDVSQDAHEEPIDNVTSSTTTTTTTTTEMSGFVKGFEDYSDMINPDIVKPLPSLMSLPPPMVKDPIGSVKVLQNNSVEVNLMHMNTSENPVHLLLSSDGGMNFEDVELKYSNLILNLPGGKDYILKSKESGSKFNFTITTSDGNPENETISIKEKMGCYQDGQFYNIGEEFHIGCTEICECTDHNTRECVDLICPSHVGLELISKGCVRWAPSPPPTPPNCCPRTARCLSDGTCHYKGFPVPNWSEVPISLTGCEQRCFCENGELDCQEVCTPLSPVPPQTLRCPPLHRPAPINISDDDCCKQWGCLPNAEDINATIAQKYHIPIFPAEQYVIPLAPVLQLTTATTATTTPAVTTDTIDFYRHLHPVKTIPKFFKTITSSSVINEPEQKYTQLIDKPKIYSTKEKLENVTVFTSEDIYPFKTINRDHFKSNPSLNWKGSPKINDLLMDFQSPGEPHNKPPDFVISDATMHNLIQPPSKHLLRPPQVKTKIAGSSKYFMPAYDLGTGEMNSDVNIVPLPSENKMFAPISTTENRSLAYQRPVKVIKSSSISHKTVSSRVNNIKTDFQHKVNPQQVSIMKVKEHHPKNVHWNPDITAHGHILYKAPNPYESVLLRPMKTIKTTKTPQVPSPLGLEQLVSQTELETEVNRNLGRSANIVQDAVAVQQASASGPQNPTHPQLPFLPTIPPEIHFPTDDIPDYDQNNLHRPINTRDPNVQGLPPGLTLSPSYSDQNKNLTVLSIQADSPTSVKLLFGLPPVLVGLRGSVDLRYTDKADEDVMHWYSQVFAPADEVLTTPRLEFRLTGLKPSTIYKIKGKLFLHNLPVEPESQVYSVRTQDLPTIPLQVMPVEEKRREVDSRLTVVDVNDTAAHVSWRHFSEDELQFIDGIQVRYRPMGTPIYSMTELLHHSRSIAELRELRPGTRYEASLILVPPPRATTELHDPGRVEFNTDSFVDPYNWTVTIEAHIVGANAAELSWHGVPSPAERWVRVYRAAHACGATRHEHDAFRLAARDLPPTIMLSGLEADTRCRVWMELFLTNGKIKTSNVLEINTKSEDSTEQIDNEIEASSIAGSRGSDRGDYYGALVVVGVVAALGALTSLLLLLVLVRRHRPRSVPITPVPSAPRESSLPPYDNPAYKLELQQETMDL